jgi:hypothetical protein
MASFKQSAARLIAVLLAGAALCACGQHDRLDADTLAREVRSLASLSAEAALLIDELRAGHLEPTFVAAHLRDLRDDATMAQHEIAKPAPTGIQQRQAAAQALATDLTQALRDIAITQDGPAARLERDRQRVVQLKRTFDALGQSR